MVITATNQHGIATSYTPKKKPVDLMLLKTSPRPASLNFYFRNNRRCSCSRLKDTRSPISNPSKRVMPRSGRLSEPAGTISRVHSNAPLTHISSNGAKARLLSLVTRGLVIGDATHLSHCAVYVSRRAD